MLPNLRKRFTDLNDITSNYPCINEVLSDGRLRKKEMHKLKYL